MRAPLVVSMRRVGLSALLVAVSGAVAGAQLPNASTAAMGMAGNYTALARGYEAIAWNPANLGMPDRPFMSLGLGVIGGTGGMDPIDFTKLHSFSGKIIDSAAKAGWVSEVVNAKRQRVRVDGGITPLAFTLGPIGVQSGTTVFSNIDLSPDMFEFAMFGNAGNNNNHPKPLDLTGTTIRFGAVSSIGASMALPVFIVPGMSIGVTAKYVLGNGLVIGQDAGSSLSSNDLKLKFGVIKWDTILDPAKDLINGKLGNGVGVDVGLAWDMGPMRIGAMAENVYNSFQWDTTFLRYSPISADADTIATDLQQPFASAPQSLKDLVIKNKFTPTYSAGVAFKLMSSLTVTANAKMNMGDENSILAGPKQAFGVGVQWNPIGILPLRAGVASITDGWQVGAGIGLRLIGYELGVATQLRQRGTARDSGIMIGVLGFGH